MERSRGGRSSRKSRGLNWRGFLVYMGALAFWISVSGQLAWDIMGSMTVGNSTWEPAEIPSFSSILGCINSGLEQRRMAAECSSALVPYSRQSLFLGILSLWWNPRLRLKVEGKSGRLTGLREYYKIQIVVLVVRFVTWACLQDPSIIGLNSSLPQAIHIFTGIFTVIVSCPVFLMPCAT